MSLPHVFDAGPLIAVVNFERGAAKVRRILRENKGSCVIHAVTLLEIYYGTLRSGGEDYADKVLDLIEKSGVEVRNDGDRKFLKDAGFLKVNHKMSLADTFAVALARRLNCPLVSTDHHELDAVHAAGVCNVLFIR